MNAFGSSPFLSAAWV
jgi:Phage integrase family